MLHDESIPFEEDTQPSRRWTSGSVKLSEKISKTLCCNNRYLPSLGQVVSVPRPAFESRKLTRKTLWVVFVSYNAGSES